MQEAQYVPGPLLRDGANEVVVLETEAALSSPSGAPNAPAARLQGLLWQISRVCCGGHAESVAAGTQERLRPSCGIVSHRGP